VPGCPDLVDFEIKESQHDAIPKPQLKLLSDHL
jgi:hypothetical protein